MIFKFSLGQKSHDALAICNIITIFQNWISCPYFQSPGLNISPSLQHTYYSEHSQGTSMVGICLLSKSKNAKETYWNDQLWVVGMWATDFL